MQKRQELDLIQRILIGKRLIEFDLQRFMGVKANQQKYQIEQAEQQLLYFLTLESRAVSPITDQLSSFWFFQAEGRGLVDKIPARRITTKARSNSVRILWNNL
ncbi:hypothetical protein SAMN05443246_5938 [Paenibacillus sp. GP183]|nr:hypothetical protein SAMN05443246_5938 [Paenibacillus sp. GP183]